MDCFHTRKLTERVRTRVFRGHKEIQIMQSYCIVQLTKLAWESRV